MSAPKLPEARDTVKLIANGEMRFYSNVPHGIAQEVLLGFFSSLLADGAVVTSPFPALLDPC